MFWSNSFLSIGDGKFELYGPLWIGITYACVLSISANVAAYYRSGEEFRFVAEYVVRAFAVTAMFGFLVPLVVSCIVKIMKGDMPTLAVNHSNSLVPVHLRLLIAMVYRADSCLLSAFAILASWDA